MTISMTQSKRGIAAALAFTLLLGNLLSFSPAFAVDPQTCTPPAASQPGVHYPTGSIAVTYTYNCDTGLWENEHYTFDPATNKTTPKEPVTYTYDPAIAKYRATVWTYSPAANNGAGAFVQDKVAVITPPKGDNIIVVGGPLASTPPSSSITNTGNGSTNTIDNNGSTTGNNSINNTGEDSLNSIGGTSDNNTDSTTNTTAAVDNTLVADAGTGNALVVDNTHGGSAASGDSQDIANVVNMLQSSSNALGGDTVTFVANIDGDVNGDLMLDPDQLGTVQPANGAVGNNNLTVNNSADLSINNDITLNVTSGDAKVNGNTEAGDATSGSAKAIANVINLINSAITSGKSFIGIININGNLNGDILIPPNFVDQLLASNVPTVTIVDDISNTGKDSTNTITNDNTSNTRNITNTNNQGITNNVGLTATSGNATVKGNTEAGNATTGKARTSITAFNLTGSSVVGRNSLLVFVNVTGTWVGMIVNAPAGATAAQLGGGLLTGTQNGNQTTTVNNDVNETITNDIDINAQSGDADVKNNTKAGNATSGDADAAVNLLNVENSSMALSNWFGILFINVFGTWNGSFGINTAAGNPPITAQIMSSQGAANVISTGAVFGFEEHAVSAAPASTPPAATTTVSNTGDGSTNNSVLAANVVRTTTNQPDVHKSYWKQGATIGGLVVLYIVGDAAITSYRAHRRQGQSVV